MVGLKLKETITAETLAAEVADAVSEDLQKLKPESILGIFKKNYPALLSFLYQFLVILLIFFLSRKIMQILLKMLSKSMEKFKVDEGVRRFVISLLKAMYYILFVFIVAERIGVNSASIIAVIGSAGIAIGLALQGSLSNLAGGVLILLMKPFCVGDYIYYHDVEGQVHMIGLVYTTLISADNKKITVPNGILSNAVVINATAYENRRLDLRIGVAYDSDTELAKRCVIAAYKSIGDILDDPEPIAYVEGFEASAIMIGGRGWCRSENYLSCKWEVLAAIKRELDKNGVEIPYNSMNVFMKKNEENGV
ncbi:MAG: mechanosensitive ion channel [Johnsonella sp.]|nr:mechanosensitive ion channel [Johnsonella sp.]